MENYKRSKYLNFSKCIVDKAQIESFHRTLHLNSNTNISPKDETSVFYYKQLNYLNLFNVNDVMKNILNSKCIDECGGLAVNYTTEQKNMLFDEIQSLLEKKFHESEQRKRKQDKMMMERKRELENKNTDVKVKQKI